MVSKKWILVAIMDTSCGYPFWISEHWESEYVVRWRYDGKTTTSPCSVITPNQWEKGGLRSCSKELFEKSRPFFGVKSQILKKVIFIYLELQVEVGPNGSSWSWVAPLLRRHTLVSFFYENHAYKNVEAQITPKIKNIVVILPVAISISFPASDEI